MENKKNLSLGPDHRRSARWSASSMGHTNRAYKRWRSNPTWSSAAPKRYREAERKDLEEVPTTQGGATTEVGTKGTQEKEEIHTHSPGYGEPFIEQSMKGEEVLFIGL
jgi:hypothetical protein